MRPLEQTPQAGPTGTHAFNRVNVATRQITGEWTDQIARHVVKHAAQAA